jgi:hypothetical protein
VTQALPDSLTCLTQLHQLALSMNPLLALPAGMSALQRLRILELYYVKLECCGAGLCGRHSGANCTAGTCRSLQQMIPGLYVFSNTALPADGGAAPTPHAADGGAHVSGTGAMELGSMSATQAVTGDAQALPDAAGEATGDRRAAEAGGWGGGHQGARGAAHDDSGERSPRAAAAAAAAAGSAAAVGAALALLHPPPLHSLGVGAGVGSEGGASADEDEHEHAHALARMTSLELDWLVAQAAAGGDAAAAQERAGDAGEGDENEGEGEGEGEETATEYYDGDDGGEELGAAADAWALAAGEGDPWRGASSGGTAAATAQACAQQHQQRQQQRPQQRPAAAAGLSIDLRLLPGGGGSRCDRAYPLQPQQQRAQQQHGCSSAHALLSSHPRRAPTPYYSPRGSSSSASSASLSDADDDEDLSLLLSPVGHTPNASAAPTPHPSSGGAGPAGAASGCSRRGSLTACGQQAAALSPCGVHGGATPGAPGAAAAVAAVCDKDTAAPQADSGASSASSASGSLASRHVTWHAAAASAASAAAAAPATPAPPPSPTDGSAATRLASRQAAAARGLPGSWSCDLAWLTAAAAAAAAEEEEAQGGEAPGGGGGAGVPPVLCRTRSLGRPMLCRFSRRGEAGQVHSPTGLGTSGYNPLLPRFLQERRGQGRGASASGGKQR